MEASEVLSAFVDGETVDPAELAAALEAPGARELLLDLVRLRAALVEDARPSAPFVDQMRRKLAERARPRPRMLRWAAAAAIGALALLGARDIGRLFRMGGDEPPRPARVLRYEPGVDWHTVPSGGPS